MKHETFIVMSYLELEKILKNNFNVTYEAASENEWNNDSAYIFRHVSKGSQDEYELSRIKRCIDAGRSKSETVWASFWLQYLVNLDIIEEGNYIIEVSW